MIGLTVMGKLCTVLYLKAVVHRSSIKQASPKNLENLKESFFLLFFGVFLIFIF